MKRIEIEAWLPLVEKPSRYIDHELNAIHKPWQQVNFCLAFPDLYEVGISHLGLKILYSILNRIEGVMADRCYLPWLDLIKIMKREGIPLFGSESRIGLAEFDLIGITLQSELTYSNVLQLLGLGQIPLLSADRDEDCPIVMAGGPCAGNPLPLSDFIDVFFIGEAEEAITEIAELFLKVSGRQARLEQLASIEGCYVPVLQADLIGRGLRVKARKFTGFHQNTHTHRPQLLPWQLATHNRYVAEIMRGCSRGCRFCHAGYFYRPVRERPVSALMEDLLAEIKVSGWDEVGLLSLSSSDYSCVKELLFNLLAQVDKDKTHVSLPSLRLDSLDDEVVELMRKLGREGLTIAPEAGSQRLRDIINKNLSEEQILEAVQIALRLGWQRLKLYFMVGLPFEVEEDINELIGLIIRIDEQARRKLQISITLSPFVPKPFTPFQWAELLDSQQLLERCLKVKQALFRRRNIKLRYHSIESSVLEAVLARGDARLGAALLQAFEQGARFDGWNECFDYGIWENAFQACGIRIGDYLGKKDVQAELPWDFVDTGVCREFLIREWEKAAQAETTADCRELCSLCGVCDDSLKTKNALLDPAPTIPVPKKPQPTRPSSSRHRYRLHYAKTGLLRFISHLDWMRMLYRLIGHTSLETVYTQGFSPHPRVSLSPPLPLGVQSRCCFFDVSYYRSYSSEEILAAFSQKSIPGFQVHRVEKLSGQAPVPVGERIGIKIPAGEQAYLKQRLEQFRTAETWPFTKTTPSRSKDYDLKRIVQALQLEPELLILDKSLASPSLYDVLGELLNWDKARLYKLDFERLDWLWN